MADEYTPTTEVVREGYAQANEAHGREFDRWLAAHDARVRREAKAEALRWASGRVRNGAPQQDRFTVANWLRDQADRIEREGGEG